MNGRVVRALRLAVELSAGGYVRYFGWEPYGEETVSSTSRPTGILRATELAPEQRRKLLERVDHYLALFDLRREYERAYWENWDTLMDVTLAAPVVAVAQLHNVTVRVLTSPRARWRRRKVRAHAGSLLRAYDRARVEERFYYNVANLESNDYTLEELILIRLLE
jgi:UDP:flavonoid glycosyltransferase YjiC (YdhE family)